METPIYRVQLDIFSGPLDLLLYLVRRSELDVLDLPVARITEQFNDMLNVIEFIDLDLAGDFVMMASSLTEIKSRLELPRADELPEDEHPLGDDDPRSELIERLIEYKRFKDAANQLEERAAEWQDRYPRLADDRPRTSKDPASDRIKEVELWDLVSALGRVLRHKEVEQQTKIRYDETPVAVYVDRIGSQVRREGEVKFSTLFEGENERSRIVGLFLAVLELLRHHHFRAEQPSEYGEIWIRPPLESGEAPPPPATDVTQPDESPP
ncbi:MAG: segregation/condensation protein A [Planctomycetaceae bacterium]